MSERNPTRTTRNVDVCVKLNDNLIRNYFAHKEIINVLI